MTKILVVDDDLLVLATTTMGLQQVGYEAMQAASGAQALQLCGHERPDLVLLDIRMPAMSGFELAKLFNEQKISFIFLSAYSDEDMVKTAAQVGALGYLIKPIEMHRIIPAIEVALILAVEQIKAGQAIDNLANALGKNREIDVAIGLLMERYQLKQVGAFEHLRNYARSNRMKVIDVANGLINGSIHYLPAKQENFKKI